MSLAISIFQAAQVKPGTVAIDAAATGGTAPYTYQWYRQQGASITVGTPTKLTGQTQSSHSDRNTQPGLVTYACVVTDATTATATATITLTNRDTAAETIDVSRANALSNFPNPSWGQSFTTRG